MCNLDWLSKLQKNDLYNYLQLIDITDFDSNTPNSSYENLHLPLGEQINFFFSSRILNINFIDFINYIKHNSSGQVIYYSDIEKISHIHNFYQNNKYETLFLRELILFFCISLKILNYTSIDGICNIDINSTFLDNNTITENTVILDIFKFIHNITNDISNNNNNRFLIIPYNSNDKDGFIIGLVDIFKNILNISIIKNMSNIVQKKYHYNNSITSKLLTYINNIKDMDYIHSNHIYNLPDNFNNINIYKIDTSLIKVKSVNNYLMNESGPTYNYKVETTTTIPCCCLTSTNNCDNGTCVPVCSEGCTYGKAICG